MMPTIEYSPLVLHEDSLAGSTFQALRALAGPAILDYVSLICYAIVGTLFVPAKRTS